MSTVFKAKVKQGLVCTHCTTPIVQVENGVLIFKLTHHEETHISIIPLDKVLELVVELPFFNRKRLAPLAPTGIVRQDLGAR